MVDSYERDVASRAKVRAAQSPSADHLPVMNRRPGVHSAPGAGDRYTPQPPMLFACDQLLPYFLIVDCDCGRVIELSGAAAAKLIGRSGKAPLSHLLSLLTCSKCGGRPTKLEILRHADRGLANAPRQIVTEG